MPQIASSALSIDFGNEVAGKLTDPQMVTISNVGEGDLIIEDAEFIGQAPADFGLTTDFCSFQILAPGEGCEIGFSMRATEIGERIAQFVIESNDVTQPLLVIEMRGQGTGSGGCRMGDANSSPADFLCLAFFALLLLFRLGLGKAQRDSRP